VTPTGTVTILHSFGDGSVANDGVNPNTQLVAGVDGNFYGVTEYGGAPIPGQGAASGVGTVFKMTPGGVVTILHSFGPGCITGDGARPRCLTQTPDGTLYGGTYTSGNAAYPHGFGIIFSISASGTYTILHVMQLADGAGVVGLIPYPDGNLYGITVAGGGSSISGDYNAIYGGTFFKITPSGLVSTLIFFPDMQSGGKDFPAADLFLAVDGTFYWYTLNSSYFSESDVLESMQPDGDPQLFGAYGESGASGTFTGITGGPFIIDPYGNLYKSTGDIEAVVPTGIVSVAHAFNGTDGSSPNALVFARNGDLYGTTVQGGSAGNGVIFKLHNAAPYDQAADFVFTPNYTYHNGVKTGSPLSFTVTAIDNSKRIAGGYAGTVHFTSNDPNAALPADSKLTNGVGMFQATFTTSNTLTVYDTVNHPVTGSSPINVFQPSKFQVTTSDTVIPGIPFNITVTAIDSFGNVVDSYPGTVHITSTDGSATLHGRPGEGSRAVGLEDLTGDRRLSGRWRRATAATATACKKHRGGHCQDVCNRASCPLHKHLLSRPAAFFVPGGRLALRLSATCFIRVGPADLPHFVQRPN